jgi:outer membrane protein TolC
MATAPGDDDYPERLAALAERQRSTKTLPQPVEPKPEVYTPPAFNQEAAELKLKLAELAAKKAAEEKFRTGLMPQLEYLKAKYAREIAAAELKQDPMEVARLRLELAAAELKHNEELFKQGVVPRMEYEKSKLIHESAAAAYERLRRPKNKF